MKRTVSIVVMALTASCGTGDDANPAFEVSSTVVSHETTQNISVWAPETEGSWPVVYALHGTGGNRQDLAETAIALASQGAVVFAADYRSTTPTHWEADAECGFRYAMSIADEHGGDLDLPVSAIGYSLGATLVLEGSLNESAYGPGGTYQGCLAGTPRADLTVALAGCHYEFGGQAFDFDPAVPQWTNEETDLLLVVGTDDPICGAWQSEDATAALRSAGYDARLVEIADANHFTVIFHDVVGDEWVTLPDDPTGMEVVRTILDAIDAAQKSG